MVETKQNNVEASMATAAAEKAPGNGSVDGIMVVQEVTKSSGPVQPKSLDVPAHEIRQRNVPTKPPTQQGGSEVSLDSSKAGDLSPKKAAENAGVVDAVRPVNCWRNMFGSAKVGIQQEPIKDVAVQNKEDEKQLMFQAPVPQSIPPPHQQSSKPAVVTGGKMDMENSNPSQENAESSCKSKTAEWALLVTSVVLEATSAIFEQLGYPLPSMVMAFVALLLSILDLILKARERGITCDGRGLLPCFYRHDVRNRKPFASLVQYFGLAGALWQCCFTTVGYHYTHHKLDNPIKLCLLPFIFALCVLISKVVKSSQHEPVVELKSR